MNRKCTSLRDGEEVVFNIYSDILKRKNAETRTVSLVNESQRKVMVHWLKGYQDRHDMIPFEDMLAVHNANGEYMTFDCISGNSDLLMPE
jgi:hypothetical protein